MNVKFFATYRDVTRVKQTSIPAQPDIRAMLALLAERYGATMRAMLYTPDGTGIGENAIILVNGRNVQHLGNMDTPLSESDTICVFPMVAGG
ncbi:MAG: MoaD family protein [Oscillospiraceae bacterium]|nr:MoaD family protein [Oscillospiraceae bacterium]